MPDLQPTTMTSASKVGDLFSAAGEAFSKLAELTRILQTAAKNDSHLSSNENSLSEAQWLASDTESLQLAVKRFGDDLNVISEHIKDKTMYQIKTTFRKIHPNLSNATTNEKSAAETSPAAATATFGAHDSSNSYAADTAAASALSSMVAPAVTAKATASSQNTSSSNTAGASNSFPQTSSANAVNPGAATAAAGCSSPSPFLHYPLLRKSADITLNMLNARDDSDDDERVSMSVFNSV